MEVPVSTSVTKPAGEVVEVAQPGRIQVGDRVVVQPQNACGECQMCAIGEDNPL